MPSIDTDQAFVLIGLRPPRVPGPEFCDHTNRLYNTHAMRFFELSILGLFSRFYLLMAVVIVAGFTGAWALAFLAVPIFLSCMLGACAKTKVPVAPSSTAKVHTLVPQAGAPVRPPVDISLPMAA